MEVVDELDSPLGALRIGLTVGTSQNGAQAPAAHVRGQKVRFEWKDVDGAAVSLLRVPLPDSHRRSAVMGWGLLWKIKALKDLGQIRIEMLLSANLEGEWWGDENEQQIEFVDANWQVTMHGMDDDAILYKASTGSFPRDWGAPLSTGDYGVDRLFTIEGVAGV